MKYLISTLLVTLILATAANARDVQPLDLKSDPNAIEQITYPDSKSTSKEKKQSEPEDTTPNGATAQCRDGSYSYSQNHRGTCSHHGGVAQWF